MFCEKGICVIVGKKNRDDDICFLGAMTKRCLQYDDIVSRRKLPTFPTLVYAPIYFRECTGPFRFYFRDNASGFMLAAITSGEMTLASSTDDICGSTLSENIRYRITDFVFDRQKQIGRAHV